MPRANGSRPMATLVIVPAANQSDANQLRMAGRAADQDVDEERRQHGAGHGDGPDADEGAEHREQHPVAQRVMPTEPVVVPADDAVALDQPDAEEVRGQIRAPPAHQDRRDGEDAGDGRCDHGRPMQAHHGGDAPSPPRAR